MEAACVNFFSTVVLANEPSMLRHKKMAEQVMQIIKIFLDLEEEGSRSAVDKNGQKNQ